MTPSTAARVRRGEDDTGRFDGDVGACADREADVGAGECGCVVDAVTDHCNGATLALEVFDSGVLVVREDFGVDVVDAELGSDAVGDRLRVAGDHHDTDAAVVERIDRSP